MPGSRGPEGWTFDAVTLRGPSDDGLWTCGDFEWKLCLGVDLSSSPNLTINPVDRLVSQLLEVIGSSQIAWKQNEQNMFKTFYIKPPSRQVPILYQ